MAMSIMSIGYVVFFLYITIRAGITKSSMNFENVDGLNLIGGVIALLEIIVSNRNFISRKINMFIFQNRQVNYKIMLSFSSCDLQISQMIEKIEQSIKQYLLLDDLKRKPNSAMTRSCWKMSYDDIGCSIECICDNICGYENKKNCNLIIWGHSKYGKINHSKKDILYLSSLIKIITSYFLKEKDIVSFAKLEKIDVVIIRKGSQIKTSDLFEDGIKDVKTYHLQLLGQDKKAEEIVINEQEIKWSTIDSRTLIDGFEYLTSILAGVE